MASCGRTQAIGLCEIIHAVCGMTSAAAVRHKSGPAWQPHRLSIPDLAVCACAPAILANTLPYAGSYDWNYVHSGHCLVRSWSHSAFTPSMLRFTWCFMSKILTIAYRMLCRAAQPRESTALSFSKLALTYYTN